MLGLENTHAWMFGSDFLEICHLFIVVVVVFVCALRACVRTYFYMGACEAR